MDVTSDRTQQLKDRFGRLLVYVDVPSGARGPGIGRYDLSQTQLGARWSKTYTFKRRVRRFDRYRSPERAAYGAAAEETSTPSSTDRGPTLSSGRGAGLLDG